MTPPESVDRVFFGKPNFFRCFWRALCIRCFRCFWRLSGTDARANLASGASRDGQLAFRCWFSAEEGMTFQPSPMASQVSCPVKGVRDSKTRIWLSLVVGPKILVAGLAGSSEKGRRQGSDWMANLSPPEVPFSTASFFGGGFHTKIDYRNKLVPSYSNLSNLEDLASSFWMLGIGHVSFALNVEPSAAWRVQETDAEGQGFGFPACLSCFAWDVCPQAWATCPLFRWLHLEPKGNVTPKGPSPYLDTAHRGFASLSLC